MAKKETKEEVWTFEMLMQSFRELREQQKISSEIADKQTAEIKKQLAESVAVADKETAEIRKMIKELSAETDRQIKETNAMVNGIGKSNGAFAEETIYSALEKSMVYGGIKFEDINPNMKRKSEAKKLQGEYDIVLKNGDTLAIIETKYRVRKDDVNILVNKKVEDFRTLFPEYNDYKIVLGIGGMSFDEEALQEANANGVGIIKVVGEKVEFQTTDIKVY
jgi:hypothetical protein